MVTIEASATERWMYVKASGFIDDWDDPPNISQVVKEAKSLDLKAILYDAGNVSGALAAKKATTNLYVLNQQIEDVRTAFVLSDNLLPPHHLAERIAKTLSAPVRFFHSVDEASRWLSDAD